MLIVAFFYHFEFSEVFYLVYYEMFDVSFSKTLVTVIYCRIKYDFFFGSVTSSLLFLCRNDVIMTSF